MMITDEILQLFQACRIAHHVPGRVRLKIDLAALAALSIPAGQAPALFEKLEKTAGLRKVSVNKLARSCTIVYDAEIIIPAAWDDLAAGVRSAAAEDLLALFSSTLD